MGAVGNVSGSIWIYSGFSDAIFFRMRHADTIYEEKKRVNVSCVIQEVLIKKRHLRWMLHLGAISGWDWMDLRVG